MDCARRNDLADTPRTGPTPRQWEDARPRIYHHYITNNLGLPATRAEMEKEGFSSSKSSYKKQLFKWSISKNMSRSDWLEVARLLGPLQRHHSIPGGPQTCVQVHHKIRRFKDLERYLKSHGIEKEAFLAEALRSQRHVPPHIKLCDSNGGQVTAATLPEFEEPAEGSAGQGDSSKSPPFRDLPNTSGDPNSYPCFGFHNPDLDGSLDELDAAELDSETLESQRRHPPDWQKLEARPSRPGRPGAAAAGFASTPFALNDADPPTRFTQLSRLNSFQCVAAGNPTNMRRNIGALLHTFSMLPTFPAGTVAPEATYLRPRAVEARTDHTEDPENAYTAVCMFACMFGAAGKMAEMMQCLERASDHVRQMCRLQHRAVLFSATVVLTWLLVHAEGSVAEEVMTASYTGATEVLGPQNPVSLLLGWMTAAAARDKQRTYPIGTLELREIHATFRRSLGEEHAHTLVALYCLSFELMRRDKDFVQAEQNLERLSQISTNVFGFSSIFTVNALATLSRAQARQDKYQLALQTIERSLEAKPLGLNHPHQLELMVRKALILRKLGRLDQTEEIYWMVVKGRVATLGRHHKTTLAAHETLVSVMRENLTWEGRKGEVQNLLLDPQTSVTDYESRWRSFMEGQGSPADEKE